MTMFWLGLLAGGAVGVLVVALCQAAAGRSSAAPDRPASVVLHPGPAVVANPARSGGGMALTDREAIRTLADIVADLCYRAEMPMSKAVCEEIRRNAAPTAPAVTREQAAWIEQVVAGAIRSRPGMGIAAEIEATILNYPAFFRAVADALELPPKPEPPKPILFTGGGKVLGPLEADALEEE